MPICSWQRASLRASAPRVSPISPGCRARSRPRGRRAGAVDRGRRRSVALGRPRRAPLGWKPLLAGHTGGAPLALGNRRPSTGLASLAGTRIAADGLGADVVRALGAEPVALPAGGPASALTDGFVRGHRIRRCGSQSRERCRAHRFLWVADWMLRARPGPQRQRHGAGAQRPPARSGRSCPRPTKPSWRPQPSKAIRPAVAEALVHERMARQVLGGFVRRRASRLGRPTSRKRSTAWRRRPIAHVAGTDAVAERIDRSYFGFPQHAVGRTGRAGRPAADRLSRVG